MEEETQSQVFNRTPSLMLQSKPLLVEASSENASLLYIAQSNNTLTLMDIEKMSVVYQTGPIHQSKIGGIRYKDNLIMTAGYDNHVKLFDARTFENYASFQRMPAKFNTIDKSSHILAAAYSNHITFWDLRKMKQRSEFKDSFNSEITCLRFHDKNPTKFGCCSVEGLISMFDLAQPNEDDAFEWCFKTMESPEKLSISQNCTLLVQTNDHILLKVYDGELMSRSTPNNIENPKHVIDSKIISDNTYEYCTWSFNEEILQLWRGSLDDNTTEQCIGHINGVSDVELVYSYGGNRAVWFDEKGGVFGDRFGEKRMKRVEKIQKNIQKNIEERGSSQQKKKGKFGKLFMKQKPEEDLNIPKMNNNGYLLNKPSSFTKPHKSKSNGWPK